MPPGLSARRKSSWNHPARRSAGIALGLWALATIATAGCNALPPSTRIVPRSSDVHTRVGSERETATTTTADPEAQAAPAPRLAFDRLDEESPLPPALESRPVVARTASLPPATPDPTPLLDAALARAGARDVAMADEVAKAAETRPNHGPEPVVEPTPAAPPPTPLLPDPAPAPRPTTAPAAKPTPVPVEPERPEEVWRLGVQRLRAVARDRLKATKDGASDSPNWAVRERLLGWLAEPDIDPDPRTGDQVAQGRAVLKGLAAVLDPKGPSASRGAEIREAVAALEAEAPLEVAELKLCRKVHGFGNIEPLDPATRKPGQPVILYCEMAGLAYEPLGPAFRSRLAAQVELWPEGGESPVWSQKLDQAEDTCRRRRRDYFVNYRITLPDTLAPGNYRLRLSGRDLVADHVATRETGLTIAR